MFEILSRFWQMTSRTVPKVCLEPQKYDRNQWPSGSLGQNVTNFTFAWRPDWAKSRVRPKIYSDSDLRVHLAGEHVFPWFIIINFNHGIYWRIIKNMKSPLSFREVQQH